MIINSIMSIHNVKPKRQRELAISEALRVLKDDGYLVIIDMEHIGEFKQALVEHGCEINVRRTGFNGLWGWIPTKVIIAKK